MGRQYQSGTGLFINNTANRQYVSGQGVVASSYASAPATPIDLTVQALSGASTIDTGAIGYTPPQAGVTNLSGASLSGGSTFGTGIISFTSAVVKIATDPLRAWGSQSPLAGLTIPHVSVSKLDGTFLFHVSNVVTDGNGQLNLLNGLLVAGSDYIVTTWNDNNSVLSDRGAKIYKAV